MGKIPSAQLGAAQRVPETGLALARAGDDAVQDALLRAWRGPARSACFAALGPRAEHSQPVSMILAEKDAHLAGIYQHCGMAGPRQKARDLRSRRRGGFPPLAPWLMMAFIGTLKMTACRS